MNGVFSAAFCIAPLAVVFNIAAAQSPLGWWETAFNHPFNPNENPPVHPWNTANNNQGFKPIRVGNATFNAIHMALIPKGLHQGKVVMWDWENYGPNSPGTYQQRWSIWNPANGIFLDGLLTLTNEGDPMCAGHAWSADGDLVVGGGNYYTGGSPPVKGHKLLWIYQPPPLNGSGMGQWISKAKMHANRWYPTVTLLADGKMMFSGGTQNASFPPAFGTDYTYELYDPVTNNYSLNPNPTGNRTPPYNNPYLFYGPGIQDVASKFSPYPRVHVLPYGSGLETSAGMVFVSGHGEKSARVDIDLVQNTTEAWFYPPGNPSPWHNSQFAHRHDGSSFLYPNLGLTPVNENTVVRLCGLVNTPATTNTVRFCVTGSMPSA